MNIMGRHIIAEFSHCDKEILTDIQAIQQAMIEAVQKANAEIREVAFHRFQPQGVSGVIVISESHLSIHTWPELGYAAVDIYTCGEHTNPQLAMEHLATQLKSKAVHQMLIERGLSNGTIYTHQIRSNSFEEMTIV